MPTPLPRRAVGLACAVALLGLAAACGGDGDRDGGDAGGSTDPARCSSELVELGHRDDVVAAARADAPAPGSVEDYLDACSGALAELSQPQFDEAVAQLDQEVLAYLGPILREGLIQRGARS